jgi:fatty-acyl-CoA synthase
VEVISGDERLTEAAAVGVAQTRWGERPVLVIVPRGAVTREALIDWLRPKVPRWWLPDDVVVVAALPRTPTGKVRKAELRRALNDPPRPPA